MKKDRLFLLLCLILFSVLAAGCAKRPADPPLPLPPESETCPATERGSFPETGETEPAPSTEAPKESESLPVQTDAPAIPEDTEPCVTEPAVTSAPETKPVLPIRTDPPETRSAESFDPDNVSITISFTGDCTLGRNHLMGYGGSFDDYYDRYGKKYFLSNVSQIFRSDDLTVINLEGPLTVSDEESHNQFMHRGRPEYAGILSSSFVDVCTLANNHRYDYMQSGATETLQTLTAEKLSWCYDSNISIRSVKGVKVGIVSADLTGRKDLAEKTLRNGIRTARDKGCKIVIACVHWGTLKTDVLSGNQLKYSQMIVDLGYDLVVGNHPHVLQAVRKIDGVFVAYSLGNFCYGGNNNPLDKDSGIFQKTFTIVDGVLQKDDNVRFIPCSVSSTKSRNDFRPTPAEGSEKDRILDKINLLSSPYSLTFDKSGHASVIPPDDTEPETEPVTEPETEPVTEPETTPETEPETEPAAESEPETASETDPEPIPDTEPETASPQSTDGTEEADPPLHKEPTE